MSCLRNLWFVFWSEVRWRFYTLRAKILNYLFAPCCARLLAIFKLVLRVFEGIRVVLTRAGRQQDVGFRIVHEQLSYYPGQQSGFLCVEQRAANGCLGGDRWCAY